MNPDDDLETELLQARPTLEPGFRGALGRHIEREGPPVGRPSRIWWTAGGAAALGLALLALAAAGVPT